MSRAACPTLALAYHGVGDVSLRRDRRLLFTPPSDLQRQVRALDRWGYKMVTFGELARRVRDGNGGGLASLTFDDGLVDNLTVLAPLLHSAGIPATVFVASGWLGKPHPDASWTRVMTDDELRALAATGVEIGGHSVNHEHLSRLPRPQVENEMRTCRDALEGIIDRAVEVFAYPFGDANEQTMSACAAAGYRAACRSGGVGSWRDPFNLPRQSMGNHASMFGLWLKRDNRYEPFVHTFTGRALRRSVRLARLGLSR